MRLSYRSNTNVENRSPLEVTEAQILGRASSNSSRSGYPRHIPVPQSTLKAHERVVPFPSVPMEKHTALNVDEQTLPERLNNHKVMDVTDRTEQTYSYCRWEPVQTYSYCKWEPLQCSIPKKLNRSLVKDRI